MLQLLNSNKLCSSFINKTNNIAFLKKKLFKCITRIMKNSAKKNHVFSLYIVLDILLV